jgi:hypothetical protein
VALQEGGLLRRQHGSGGPSVVAGSGGRPSSTSRWDDLHVWTASDVILQVKGYLRPPSTYSTLVLQLSTIVHWLPWPPTYPETVGSSGYPQAEHLVTTCYHICY